MGNSNLARISFVERKDAQVVSYSGLKLDPLLKLLTAFKFGKKSKDSKDPGRQPKHVIFSVGLNDRTLAHSTNETNLNKVYLEAVNQFPNSKISFYQQPFDHRLPKTEKEALVQLNAAIQDLCTKHGLNCIAPLPSSKFAVGKHDHIHWTENCANDTVKHLFESLSFFDEPETESPPLN